MTYLPLPSSLARHGLPRLIILALVAALAAGFAAPAAAEEDDQPTLKPAVPESFDPGFRGLDPSPMVIEALGLAMYRPAGSVVTTDRVGGQLVVSLLESASSPNWRVSIQHLRVNRGSSPSDQIDQHLDALREADRDFEQLHSAPLAVSGMEGHLTYIRQEAAGGEDVISGWFILPTSPDVHLVFSILAMPDSFDQLRQRLEAGFETINIRSAAELSLQRRSRMERGRRYLASITPERLREMIGISQWARIYKPASDGSEREVGYSLLEVYEAKRGELTPDKPEDQYSSGERADGLMVRLRGRIIGDAQRGVFYDSIAQYWIAWDQSEEAWSIRGTQRQGEATRSESEIGLRLASSTGQPQPTLQVVRQRASDYQRNTNDWAVPDVYLSQALGMLLGRLLATEDEQRERELSYYFYNYSQSTPQLTKRVDHWAPSDDNSGNWTLTTRLTVDSKPIVSKYTSSGEFLKTTRADGSLTTPTSLDQLRTLWRRKGLPLGD